jgi:hypothetical protein
MLLLCRHPGVVPVVDPAPNWVSNWLLHRQRRAGRSVQPAEEAAAPASMGVPAVQPKRLEQMTAGMALLEVRLSDLLRQGLVTLEDRAEPFWQSLASRLVDAKLGAVARRLRALPEEMRRSDWPAAVLAEVASVFLLARAYRNLSEHPDGLRHDILTLGGWSPRKEDVLRLPGTTDRWMVAGQVYEKEDDNLLARRTWFVGAGGNFALLLDFSWRDAGFDREWPPGTVWRGTMHPYPSAYPLRMVAGELAPEQDPFEVSEGYLTADELLDAYAAALALLPWIPAFPVCMREMLPIYRAGEFFLVDGCGGLLPVQAETVRGWTLVALGAGRPLTVLGCWDGKAMTIFGVMVGGRFRYLPSHRLAQPTDEGGSGDQVGG